jgi:hypothetical protein
MQQITNLVLTQATFSFEGRIPRHLLHPALLRLIRDSRDGHLSGLQMEEEQHVVGHQSSPR